MRKFAAALMAVLLLGAVAEPAEAWHRPPQLCRQSSAWQVLWVHPDDQASRLPRVRSEVQAVLWTAMGTGIPVTLPRNGRCGWKVRDVALPRTVLEDGSDYVGEWGVEPFPALNAALPQCTAQTPCLVLLDHAPAYEHSWIGMADEMGGLAVVEAHRIRRGWEILEDDPGIVAAHEMGHLLGREHSADCRDVMSFGYVEPCGDPVWMGGTAR